MYNNYEIKNLRIENLYVNPDNARFINAEEIPDELSAIQEIVKLNTDHVINLAKDIAADGLNPNELPIVIYNSDIDLFLVMEGNRRITSIKLMTQYQDQINNIDFKPTQKRELLSLRCNVNSVQCVVYKSEEQVNYILEKLHTYTRSGVNRVMWDPQAKDRHKEKSGVLSKRLAIVKMLSKSKYTYPEAKLVLTEDKWLSKLDRFEPDKYMFYFGIKFDFDNNILLYIEESEVVKGLSQLVLDLYHNTANVIAQTEILRFTYLANFPADKKPDLNRKNDLLLMFDVEKEIFVVTNIKNEYEKVSYDIDLSKYVSDEHNINYTGYDNKLKDPNGSDAKQNTVKVNLNSDSNPSPQKYNKPNINNGDTPLSQDSRETTSDNSASSGQGSEENPTDDSIYSTDKRNTLIPKNENLPITNQRVADLYEELKLINVSKYVNVVSISLRSLIEFSINCFLVKHYPRWVNNNNIKLIEKLQKVLSILEGKKGKKNLQSEIPAIYMWLDTYETNKSNCRFDSIAGLNILIHNHLYHPSSIELKTIYNNYSPFLKNIWDEI